MRELSTVERGDFTRVQLDAVARDALRLARIDEAGAPIAIEPSLATVPPVLGNADRLVQVVLNLLVNARHALRDVSEPRISIATRADAGFVELVVRDNGPGIPDGLRDRVFDPFFTTRGPDEGTGLGLAIAFDIAREHDGVLEERSGKKAGACFALRIPAAASPGEGARGRAGRARAR
jgi:signal transduction histidine kinase